MAVVWKLESTARWIRAQFGGMTIADSKRARLMIESPHELTYYFPEADVQMDLLTSSDYSETSGYRGTAHYYSLHAGDKQAENAAWTYRETLPHRPDLTGYIAFKWNVIDAWFEEAEQQFVHPRNPYHRVDSIPSTRHIRVEIDGVTVADTQRPVLLFETGLPTRYYIPQEDIHMSLLMPTSTHTRCPYKGEASYWNVDVNGKTHGDIVWGYLEPIPESPKIKGLLSFYNEKLDIYVDGVLEERPRTVWS
jgi:uncharacterized protein (DUF427 family)